MEGRTRAEDEARAAEGDQRGVEAQASAAPRKLQADAHAGPGAPTAEVRGSAQKEKAKEGVEESTGETNPPRRRP